MHNITHSSRIVGRRGVKGQVVSSGCAILRFKKCAENLPQMRIRRQRGVTAHEFGWRGKSAGAVNWRNELTLYRAAKRLRFGVNAKGKPVGCRSVYIERVDIGLVFVLVGAFHGVAKLLFKKPLAVLL